MKKENIVPIIICGATAGAVNGFFGAGGGMLLVPLLSWLTDLEDNEIFPTSVAIIAPLCIVSLFLTINAKSFPLGSLVPYLIGSGLGGVLSGIFGQKISTRLLHKVLGLLVLWGGIRYLC